MRSISGSGEKPRRESRGQRPLAHPAQGRTPRRGARRTGGLSGEGRRQKIFYAVLFYVGCVIMEAE